MLTKLNKGRRGGGGTGLGRGIGTVGYITLLSRAKVSLKGWPSLCVTRDVLRIVTMSRLKIVTLAQCHIVTTHNVMMRDATYLIP